MKQKLLIILLLFSSNLPAQVSSKKITTAQEVFNRLVDAYASTKSPPSLKMLPRNLSKSVAQYITSPTPTIQIDETLYDICMSLGKDSANALSIIIGHELAHYYNDHSWCSDYAFALRNSTLGTTLNKVSKESKIEKESIADSYGLFYSSLAGYKPFDVFNLLLDKIYKQYKLPEVVPGYPSKKERKEINKIQRNKIEKLIPVFEAGVILIYAGKYEEAITCFTYLNKFFPSRENYNNLGTARLLWAIQLKPQQAIEFIYPVEIDPSSRLSFNSTRNLSDEEQKQMLALLQSAKRDFEKAISLDPGYSNAYINLACVYDLLGNYEAAIGRINDMPASNMAAVSSLEVKAIAYAHADNAPKAENCFLQLLKLTNKTDRYNYKMFTLSRQSLLASENFKEQWLNQSITDSTLLYKIMNEVKSINSTNNKEKPKEVITKINELSLVSIKSKFYQNIREFFVQMQGTTIHIQKYLLKDDIINEGSEFSSWHIISKQPLLIIQKTEEGYYAIAINQLLSTIF